MLFRMKRTPRDRMSTARIAIIVAICLPQITGCFFFRKKSPGKALEENTSSVLGVPLGEKAGGPDYATLGDIYNISTTHNPAAIRADPDTYVRNILLQYRSEGSVVARNIGRVEAYRQLLGGASQDFATTPQETFDATSLLANMTVAQEICVALVDPNGNDHPGWSTILPNSSGSEGANIRFLAQRFLGIHTNELDSAKIDLLHGILDAAKANGQTGFGAYVPVCIALALDAEALLL